MTIERSIPDQWDKCVNCKRKESTEEFVDLVRLQIGSCILVLCNSCSLELTRLLLDRFSPVWGDGPVWEYLQRQGCHDVDEFYSDEAVVLP